MCFYLTSLARYSSSSVWNYYLESHGFYFSSDFLVITIIMLILCGMEIVFILILKIVLMKV